MRFGLMLFLTSETIGVTELAREAEARGFESLFLGEHSHIPVSQQSIRTDGSEPPREYTRFVDPFVAFGAAAAVTSRLKLGSGVCLAFQRDPIYLAKEIATLDVISNGRYLFGVGGGWNVEEMANHGVRPADRWKILREHVLAIKQIWAEEEAEFHGEFVNFDPIWSWPKPVQQPHPPVLVGGSGPHTLRRVIEYGDEWMPIQGRTREPLGVWTSRLQEMAEEAGRSPIPVSIFWARPELREIQQYATDGVSRCIFMLPAAGREVVLPALDRLVALAQQYKRAGAS
ncbi:MAG: LLM class F420-dependent oxidoreductase [Chloroflexi bacterium]|nr:LLM class F420-dependent oxidoreductase [Chloroflexota bacterium]